MTSSIKDKIFADMKTAMRGHEKDRLAAIRLIMAAIKQREVDDRIELTDEQVLGILNKMIKQRRDSIAQFETGNRPDLVAIEVAEVNIIQQYLPAQLSEADVTKAVTLAIQSTGASSAKDMGKVMGILKEKLQGAADMTLVSAKVKEHLSR
ncbi:MAG: glutamyl-tRNA amidotransferase [Gammaproteobacteria bacterium RIFCSPHIGHO2_12_FULL_45_12]|nr:MAG: glutamyl-tRNA amidotransferase [Gammaproteobacteria bacterium RIFCSPHIGHO2_12_FULL_45_12]